MPYGDLIHSLAEPMTCRKTLVAAYVPGCASLAQLTNRCGISDYSIRMILHKAEVPPQRRRVTVEQEIRVHE